MDRQKNVAENRHAADAFDMYRLPPGGLGGSLDRPFAAVADGSERRSMAVDRFFGLRDGRRPRHRHSCGPRRQAGPDRGQTWRHPGCGRLFAQPRATGKVFAAPDVRAMDFGRRRPNRRHSRRIASPGSPNRLDGSRLGSAVGGSARGKAVFPRGRPRHSQYDDRERSRRAVRQ